jgi:26S proteasome regulatory subunit (ATPase 3-interacting protein)
MDTQISELRLALPVLKSSLKLATSKINTILDAPTSTQLASTIESLQEENEKKKRKLEGFRTGEVKQISKEEMDKVDKEYKYWANKSKARKKAFQGVEDILLSHFSREELWEKAGIEGDDE